MYLQQEPKIDMVPNVPKQTWNDTAIGSPIGPLLADEYVSYLEEKFMTRIRTAGVEHYKRFVDDTFTLVRTGTDESTILNILLIATTSTYISHANKKRTAISPF